MRNGIIFFVAGAAAAHGAELIAPVAVSYEPTVATLQVTEPVRSYDYGYGGYDSWKKDRRPYYPTAGAGVYRSGRKYKVDKDVTNSVVYGMATPVDTSYTVTYPQQGARSDVASPVSSNGYSTTVGGPVPAPPCAAKELVPVAIPVVHGVNNKHDGKGGCGCHGNNGGGGCHGNNGGGGCHGNNGGGGCHGNNGGGDCNGKKGGHHNKGCGGNCGYDNYGVYATGLGLTTTGYGAGYGSTHGTGYGAGYGAGYGTDAAYGVAVPAVPAVPVVETFVADCGNNCRGGCDGGCHGKKNGGGCGGHNNGGNGGCGCGGGCGGGCGNNGGDCGNDGGHGHHKGGCCGGKRGKKGNNGGGRGGSNRATAENISPATNAPATTVTTVLNVDAPDQFNQFSTNTPVARTLVEPADRIDGVPVAGELSASYFVRPNVNLRPEYVI